MLQQTYIMHDISYTHQPASLSDGHTDSRTDRPASVYAALCMLEQQLQARDMHPQVCWMTYWEAAEGVNSRCEGCEATHRCPKPSPTGQAVRLLLCQIKGESISNQGSHHKRQHLLLLRREEVLSHWPKGLIHHL